MRIASNEGERAYDESERAGTEGRGYQTERELVSGWSTVRVEVVRGREARQRG